MFDEHYYTRRRISNYSSNGILTVLDNNGAIYEGNFSFFEVWSRLDGKSSVNDIVESIQQKYYSSEPAEIENDVHSIIYEMLKYGLIVQGKSAVPQINKTDNHILSAQIAITSFCNLRCNHCYLINKNYSCISLDGCKTVFKNLADNGVLTVEISGGEPLMHKEFFNIIKLAKGFGFYIKLFTNATLINPSNVNTILELIDSFRISLDGEQITHDLRRGKGAFDKTICALHLLKGSNVQINMTVDDQNYHDIKAVQQIAKELNLKFEMSPVVPYSHIAFTHNKLLFIQDVINQVLSEERGEIKRANFRGINCDAAVKTIYISSSLDVAPCPLLYQDKWCLGSLKTSSLREVLSSDKYKVVLDTLNRLKSTCSGCNKCQFWCAAIVDQTPHGISPFCIEGK